ncbi:DedA family protein [Microbacterium sp. cf332]|uniref:DedA family protein n=1 Tax=Microbacterium sp. cf332 TaxID=1761804 RepID=UPI00087F568C|nr:VTT domain-containing protein [Microbacterium sp. cf332]SDQ21508.1 membrane protein DedA, SNARE-associated domain [Microbacterium sp. cf332]
MFTDVLVALSSGPWLLAAVFALVLLDSVLVVVPGEIAVTAAGTLATATGSPPLVAVVAVAASAAFCGDALCYAVGRRIGLRRWRWTRHRRVQNAVAWAGRRLVQGTATVVFTARFIPFARLAVNLTAGATRVPAPRFLAAAALAAIVWAGYQSVVGAAFGLLLPDDPLVAVVLSVAAALALGAAIDAIAAAVARRRGTITPPRDRRAGDRRTCPRRGRRPGRTDRHP